ncbi:MAG: chemotaxis protein CheX [Bryobacteraceae bacterium]
MIKPVDSQEIAEIIRSATYDVFRTMLDLPLEHLPAHEKPDPPDPYDGVLAMVGIGGTWVGTGRISSPPVLACKLAEAMLMTPCPAISEEVLDASAEIANMIIGNVKTDLEEKLGPLALSVPTVIFGRNYRAFSAGMDKWTVVPFRTGDMQMDVSFCIKQARAIVHPYGMHKHEPAHAL